MGGEKGKPEDKDAETTVSVWRLMEAPTVLIPLRGGVRWEQRGHHSARHTGGPWRWEEWLGSQLTQTTQKKVRSEQGTSLVIQWLRLCLLMQGVHVWSLVGQVRSPHTSATKPKTWNRSNIVTNLIQNLKMAHLQKPWDKKKKEVSKGFRYSLKVFPGRRLVAWGRGEV